MDIDEHTKDILTEIINIGVGRASSSLSELLDRPIELQIPELSFFRYSELEKYLKDSPHERYVCVTQRLGGDVVGEGVLSFPLENGKTLVDVLLDGGEDEEEAEFSMWELEAVQEVGNIVINAVGSVISDLSGIHIHYQLPDAAISDYPVNKTFGQEQQTEGIYCYTTTTFFVEGIDISGSIILILSDKSVKIICEKINNNMVQEE